jgi:EamA domain-containing membrane protein RarD
MHRPTVAFLTVLMIVGAVVLWIWPPNPDDVTLSSLQGALVKVSILMAALWLAEPTLRRFPPWMVLVGLVGIVLFLAALRSPAVLRVAIPVVVILWLTRRTKPKVAAKSSSVGP